MTTVELIFGIALKHLQGQHNQKRHGWRYGSYNKAVSSLRKTLTREDQSVYRKRANLPGTGELQATKKPYIAPPPKPATPPEPPKPTKFATVVINDFGGISINTKGNYNAAFVEEIKTIPKEFRSWNPKAKMWTVKKEMGAQALAIAKKHYNFNEAEDKTSGKMTVSTPVKPSKVVSGIFKEHTTNADAMLAFSNNPAWQSWKNGLTHAEKSAISSYTGSGYREINKHFRDGAPISDKAAANAKRLDSALSKGTLNENTMLYRGFPHEGMYQGANSTYKVGGTFTDKGFGSTSTISSFSKSWAQQTGTSKIFMRIKAPSGTNGGFFNIKDSSGSTLSSVGAQESEFLLPRNTTYRIDGIEKDPITGLMVYDVTIT